MSETIQSPMDDQGGGRSSKVWLIVVIVVVVLCCAVITCGGLAYYLYQNGDEIFKDWLMIFPYIWVV